MRTTLISLLLLLACVTSACVALPGGQPAALTISAAADVQPAFEEIAKGFTAATGVPVLFNFGSTGALAQQIAAGAPADIFAAASTADIEALARKGLVIPETLRLYAIGRLVLYAPAGATTGADIARIEDLARPEVRRIAIANPDHAPYGVAAQQALQAAGVLDAVQDRLIMGESAAQAFQYAETGNVDVALAPLSLTIGKPGAVHPVPGSLHDPIVQAIGVLSASPNTANARAFVEYVTGPAGRDVLARFGYDLPPAEAAP